MRFFLPAGSIGDVLAPPEQLEDAQRQVPEHIRLRLAPGFEKLLERARVRRFRQRGPVRGRDLHDARPAFWRTDDTSDRRPSMRRQEASGDAVGRDHEALDDVAGAIDVST